MLASEPTFRLDVDSRTKKVVHGFIHLTHKEIKFPSTESIIHHNIPHEIIWICLCYYYSPEVFVSPSNKQHKRQVKLSQMGRTATCCFSEIHLDTIRIAASTSVASIENLEYKWHIKINKRNKSMIQIGIEKTDSNGYRKQQRYSYYGTRTIETKPAPCIDYGYGSMNGYTVSRTINEQYGNCYDTNDIIMVHLNMKNRTLSFSVNDVDQGIAFQNLPKGDDIHYRLVVKLQQDDIVTIQAFGNY